MNAERVRRQLADFDLGPLFVEELGWDRYEGRLEVSVDGESYSLDGIAEKRGMVAFLAACERGALPDYATRRKIERQAARAFHEHLIVYADAERTTQVWQWVRRESGRPTVCREQTYRTGQTGEALIQRLDALVFSLAEEAGLTIVDVTQRARAAFDVERVTRRFYDRFKTEHDAFLGFIAGLRSQEELEWYASVTINRLMFIYFIQKKGFLDGDRDYLRSRMRRMQESAGADQFYTFYRHFLLRLFHEGLGSRARGSELDALLGQVPYLNGGLFDVHELEEANPDIEIPDEAFEGLFDFFDSYQWHLDDRPLRNDTEINPDVLGYIFEKYVNQKQMGAYYTKEDITGYIAASTLIPRFFERLAGRDAGFDLEFVRALVRDDPDRYIHEAMQSPAGREPRSSQQVHYDAVRGKLAGGDVASVSDLVTLNLNLRQLAQDVVEGCNDRTLLTAIFEELQSLTVLDPTCGSGAFLFAALNILEPLYQAALDRMEAFVVDAAGEDEHERFGAVIEEVGRHASPTFFVLKAIVVNNLYGVDIMEEAIEICKLRLFLKLVAEVDRPEHLEPLPDIDFNIRAGNALVGFTDFDHVRRSIEGEGQAQLDVHGAVDKINAAAYATREATEHHRALHVAGRAGDEELRNAKQDVRSRLGALRRELNGYLANEYGVNPEDDDAYPHWLTTHEPFHWLVEFYGVMSDGGFDVVIGNPPWREYAQVRGTYTIRRYNTERCGNLHAFCTERALSLTDTGGYTSFIVQLPMVSAKRMAPVRSELRTRSSALWIATFDDRPGKLFDGLENCRSTIFVSREGSADEEPMLAVTGYERWSTVERALLFDRLSFTRVDHVPLFTGLFPKFKSDADASVFAKVEEQSSTTLSEYVRRAATPTFVFYQESARYWVKASVGLPFYARNGVVGAPPHGRYLYLPSERHAYVTAALLNSSLFYAYFIAYGDCFHVSSELVSSFPIPATILADEDLVDMGRSLMRDIKANATHEVIQTRAGDRIEYDEFNVSESKEIVDEIDAVLARHYDFDDEELETVREFDVAFRLGLNDVEVDVSRAATGADG